MGDEMFAIGLAAGMTSNTDPAKCPKCGKEENIKTVCAWCNYKYPEECGGWSGRQWFWGTTLILIGLWVLITLTVWAVGVHDDYGDKMTLIAILKSQGHWIIDLFHRIK